MSAERDIARNSDKVKGKPAAILDKIVEGTIEKYYATACLLEQPFIKNDKQTVKDFVASKISELGENIVVRRFVRLPSWRVGRLIGLRPFDRSHRRAVPLGPRAVSFSPRLRLELGSTPLFASPGANS